MSQISIELPEPSSALAVVNENDEDCEAPAWVCGWRTVSAWSDGVAVDDDEPEDVESVREFALALLAACDRVESWRSA